VNGWELGRFGALLGAGVGRVKEKPTTIRVAARPIMDSRRPAIRSFFEFA